MKYNKEEINKYREEYQKRKKLRITLFFATLALLILLGIFVIPLMNSLGINKLIWAPFAYIIIFAIILASSFIWKCPACNASLGDIFSTRYCPECGLDFEEKAR